MSKVAQETIPEFTKNDFIVEGSAPETYRYPFESTQGYRTVLETWPDHFETSPFGEEFAKTGKIFAKNSLNLQDMVIQQAGGPVIEVGGPTSAGFVLLDGVNLPDRPTITNVGSGYRGTTAGAVDQLNEAEKLTLDIMADSGHLPVRDKSVGILVASCLLKHNAFMRKSAPEDVRTEILEAINTMSQTAERAASQPKNFKISDEEVVISSRLGFWKEAARTVKQNGVVVYQGYDEQELTIAQALGFELVAHDDLKMPDGQAREIMLRRKPETHTNTRRSRLLGKFGLK